MSLELHRKSEQPPSELTPTLNTDHFQMSARCRSKLRGTVVLLGAWALGALPVVSGGSPFPVESDSGVSLSAARALEAKIHVLTDSAPKPAASYAPVVITEDEANSYLKLRGHEFMPAGVENPEVHIMPNTVSGAAEVDFDRLNQATAKTDDWGKKFLSWFFRGKQRVRATGKLQSGSGQGKLTIETVTVGNAEIPAWLVNLLLENYVQSRYNIDLSKPFALPGHVTDIELGSGRATFRRSSTKSP